MRFYLKCDQMSKYIRCEKRQKEGKDDTHAVKSVVCEYIFDEMNFQWKIRYKNKSDDENSMLQTLLMKGSNSHERVISKESEMKVPGEIENESFRARVVARVVLLLSGILGLTIELEKEWAS